MTDPVEDDAHLCAARAAAALAVASVARGDAQGAFNALMDFLGRAEHGSGSGELLLTVLFEASATMACTMGVFLGSTEPVRIGALDDDCHPVEIDEAAPVERSFVRALLAEIHGDRQATLNQIQMVFETSDPTWISSLVMRTLAGTAALLDACAQLELPVPDWLVVQR
ncbi:MAG TPA: hypothetical protein VFQ77_20335 [Pseudonocardiaceae bacterium]|nr:hypothetical protein [Pseudonocardiaceae bacterium]